MQDTGKKWTKKTKEKKRKKRSVNAVHLLPDIRTFLFYVGCPN